MKLLSSLFLISLGVTVVVPTLAAAPAVARSDIGNARLASWLNRETTNLAQQSMADIATLAQWTNHLPQLRQQLLEMLSLDPMPPRTDLKPVVTGQVEHELFRVENLHFQSSPGLYVTANLYLPKTNSGPAPTILYVCGHGPVVKDGVPFGNKVTYQHHGAWFAQHGYVCLLIDTVQLGEIAGIHHGTHREEMWWWNSRGYTSAGVEAWNSLRALDYLATRPEVDTNRFGVTGRSGGGAYSWWLAAIDPRVKAAAPVAGITDLHNHVIDGAVEGHCDCMYTVNTYRWDYAQVAALVAPRPLLIVNTDNDSIFPLDGVMRIHRQVRKIYDLYGASAKLGLAIGPGPHKDTQDLQMPVFRWFNQHLRNGDPVVDVPALKHLQPEQLKVLKTVPADERTSRIHETFIAAATIPPVPADVGTWTGLREGWLNQLREKSFRAWPKNPQPAKVLRTQRATSSDLELETHVFETQPGLELELYVTRPVGGAKAQRVTLRALDQAAWVRWTAGMRDAFVGQFNAQIQHGDNPALGQDQLTGAVDTSQLNQIVQAVKASEGPVVWFAPRGVGPTAASADPRKHTHVRRRFMLLGQTLGSAQVWDMHRAVETIRTLPGAHRLPVWIEAEGDMACNAIYATLFSSGVERLNLHNVPPTHQHGPDYLNVLRILDIPQALAMAAERSQVRLQSASPLDWSWPMGLQRALRWDANQLVL